MALALVAHVAGCGGSNPGLGNGGSSSGGSNDGGAGSDPPHAVGTIVLGESHAPSGGGASTPMVLASFAPDSTALPQTCATQVAGCSFVAAPVCGASGIGCNVGEACTWDAGCHPKCTAQCTLTCGVGQECYFPSPNQPACRNSESFDAGAIAFAGTTTPITLFPPYQYDGQAGGAPFLAGAQLEVQASGATAAGFAKFDEKFTATTFLQTNPPIDKIPAQTVFGPGNVPIGWAPGNDTVVVTVSGVGGIATCTANDSAGSYQIPRAVVSAALGKGGGSALSLAVSRERNEWHKSESTRGQMTTAKVQPVGWLELTTISTEATSFQGCSLSTETMCVDGCFDTQVDPYHCGSCTTVCGSNQTCVGGTCTTGTTASCTTCESNANAGSCYSAYTTCTSDTQCGSYASCAQGCGTDTTCRSSCQSTYPTGYQDYVGYYDCICYTACSSECSSACVQGP
jgi:hypothetical protein